MKTFVVFVFLAVCGLANCLPDGDKYSSKFDSAFTEENLTNPKRLKTYLDCMLGEELNCPDETQLMRGWYLCFGLENHNF